MATPRVSIITPSYNQAAFLEQTITSVLTQDYPNLEYIIIDGASSDASSQIIEKYAPRLAYWVSEPDHGQAEAINKGFARASGEIIAWLNSDDLYRPGAIRAAVEALAKHPEASFVFSDVDSIDADGQVFNRMHYGNWRLQDLMCFKIIGQPGVIMRRAALLEAGPLDTSFHYLLDHHLWLRLAAIGTPQHIKGQIWAAARVHEGAKNIAQAANFGPEAQRIAAWMGNDTRFKPLSSQLQSQIWSGAYRFDAFYQLEAGRASESLKRYWKSFILNPATALKDWRRIAYASVSLLGLGKSRGLIDRQRRKHFAAEEKPKQGK